MLHPPPVRPTFEIGLNVPVDEAVATLRAALDANAAHPFEVLGQHVVVTVPSSARHFWSPWLTMETAQADSGSVLHGRFSPKPAVWTAFMLSYIALITAGVFGLCFAASLAIIGRPGWLAGLLGLASLAVALAMYIASQLGQRLARAQIHELHQLVRDALQPITINPPGTARIPPPPGRG